MEFDFSLEFAKHMDAEDPFRKFRDRFHFPNHAGKEALYFTGNSLGLQPKSAEHYINEELQAWKEFGVDGHFQGGRPWFHYHKFSKGSLAKIVGSKESEVVAMNNLTTNLHLLMVTFYKPNSTRYKILIESGAFPSDQYVVETQIKYHGFNPETSIVEVSPREGNHCLSDEDILEAISNHSENLALVLFSGVQYYTGQLFNLKKITEAAHEIGIPVGFDLAHAAGNIPLNLHNDHVDFAAWCSYKYLNSGPGNTSGIYIHDLHGQNTALPRFGGWWGHDEESRFQMKKGFQPMKGADGWQTSNANVLSTAALLASLKIFDEAPIKELRIKSKKLSGYLESILKARFKDLITIITPANPEERGCQLSLIMHENGKKIFDDLTKQGVVVDWREPDVMRIAPVPLYNSFEDVFLLGSKLEKIMRT